ncbi:hypothetical protein AAC387_Pa03g0536 [Persea americana]
MALGSAGRGKEEEDRVCNAHAMFVEWIEEEEEEVIFQLLLRLERRICGGKEFILNVRMGVGCKGRPHRLDTDQVVLDRRFDVTCSICSCSV